MKKIAFIGECMVELNGVRPSLFQTYGGDTLNSATYMSRLCSDNVEVAYITSIGVDPLSLDIKRAWEEDGINTQLVLHNDKKNMGLYIINVDDTGERTFTYWRSDSAAKYLMSHPKAEETFAALKKFDAVVLSGITLGIMSREDRKELFAKLINLRLWGVKIIFDSNYRPALWDCIEDTIEAYDNMFEVTDIALVTLDDEQALRPHEVDVHLVAERILRTGTETVVIKNDRNGSFCFDSQNSIHIPTVPVDVVDSTAAGDSYNAGFLSHYLNGFELTKCCEAGNKVAGIVVQHRGAIAPKSETEHLRVINETI
ncbi:sugar kinase [Vibrio sp. DNB22_10_4]